MLARLRRRFMLIIMGLVGLVLLVVLAVSVVSNYQNESSHIEQAIASAIDRGPDGQQRPGVGRKDFEPLDQMTPVYVALVDLESSVVLSDNSNFIYINNTLTADALDKIKALVTAHEKFEAQTLTGLLLNQGLFYRVVIADNGSVTVALADASSLLTRTVQMTLISALIWLGAMIVFFFVSLWLSKLALRPTAEAWMRQRHFIADASHELKTPLTVILANNSLILAHPEKTIAEQERWVNSTQAEAQRMDALVRELLLLAQTDEAADKKDKSGLFGKRRSVPNPPVDPDGTQSRPPLDFSAVVNRNLLQFEAVFFERNIDLQISIAEDVSLDANEEQLNQLLKILLDNASKYAGRPGGSEIAADKGTTPHSRPVVSITLQPGSGPKQHAVLQVSNTGEAIAPDVLPHLFERFYRGDAAHSDTEGSGLGLSLAQAIVEAHHGSISATSTAENGTVFTVVL